MAAAKCLRMREFRPQCDAGSVEDHPREWRVLGDNNRLIAEAALRREDTARPSRG